jgi:hypothetical protein
MCDFGVVSDGTAFTPRFVGRSSVDSQGDMRNIDMGTHAQSRRGGIRNLLVSLKKGMSLKS